MRFASVDDFRECEALHKTFGTTYYFATKHFPKEIQKRTHAVYGFVRVPDEWVDNPGPMSIDDRRTCLDGWRTQLLAGLDGVRPDSGVMRAFVDTCRDVQMPVSEPLEFLRAMETDLTVGRYGRYVDLQDYMNGSASAVGSMMLWVLEEAPTETMLHSARLLGEAMQMTNFLRDVGEDVHRGRIYLPLEDMDRFGVTEGQILERRFDEKFAELMAFEIARTRGVYREADAGIALLGPRAQKAVLLARVLYSEILDEIEKVGGNVFAGRVRTSRGRKIQAAAQVMLNPAGVLAGLSGHPSTPGARMSPRI